jgi:hypothetical protein
MFHFLPTLSALLLIPTMTIAVASPQPIPLETLLNSNIMTRASGRTDTHVNWNFGTIFRPNPKCWLYGVQFSGWAQATAPSQQERNVVLVTPKHGLTCAHAFGSPPGTPVVMLGTNGLKYTNTIASTIGGLSDLLLVIFASEWPAAVTPWRVLSTNDIAVLDLSQVHALWYRNNTQKMNTCGRTFSVSDHGWIGEPVTGIPFFEPTATGGDSGSPVFLLHENRPILLWLVHTSDLGGPFVSKPVCFEWLSAKVAPYRLSTARLRPGEP